MHRFAELLSHGNTPHFVGRYRNAWHSYVLDLFAAADWRLA